MENKSALKGKNSFSSLVLLLRLFGVTRLFCNAAEHNCCVSVISIPFTLNDKWCLLWRRPPIGMGSECALRMRGVGPHPALFGFREQRPRLPTNYRDTLSPMGKHSPQKGRPGTWKSTGGYQGRTRHTERSFVYRLVTMYPRESRADSFSLLKSILWMLYTKLYRVSVTNKGADRNCEDRYR